MGQKCLFLSFALCLCALLFAGNSAQAFVIKTGDEITIAKDEAISETLLAAGQSVTIDADVDGDIICAGQNININGNVSGDVLCAGQNITISGSVIGNVRGAAQAVKIEGPVAKNITVAAQTLSAASSIEGEMAFAAQRASIGGEIKKDVAGMGDSITIGGIIGGDAQLQSGSLTLKNGGGIGGSLNYISDRDAAREDGFAMGAGITRHNPSQKDIAQIAPPAKTMGEAAADKIGELVLNLVVALLLVFFFKKFIVKSTDAITAKTGRAFGWGLLLLVAGPLLIISLFLTLIGIPLALIVLILYIIALFVSRILAAIAAGRIISAKIWKNQNQSLYPAAAIGVVVFWILFSLPVIGWIISAAAMIWGFGGIWYIFKKSPIT